MRLTNHAISIIFKYVGKKKNPDKTQSVWGVKHWKLAALSIQVAQCQPLFSFVFIVVIYIFIHSCICLFVRCSLDSIVFSLGWDESFFIFYFFIKRFSFLFAGQCTTAACMVLDLMNSSDLEKIVMVLQWSLQVVFAYSCFTVYRKM